MTLVVMALAFTSCGGDDDDEGNNGPSAGAIELSQTTVSFSGNGGSATVNVSNAIVSRIETKADWVNTYVSNGNSLLVVAEANNTGHARSAYVYIYSSDNRSTSLNVTQGTAGSNPGSDPNPGGSNPGGDNPGGGTPGGNDPSAKAPVAPTNLHVSSTGSAAVPNCILRWDASAGATSYIIYRSTRETGGYTQIGTEQYNSYADQSVKIGNTYYYRVKAKNSKGTSDYSNTCKYEFKDARKPGPAHITSATCSGTNITVRWSVPTDVSYGKPTSVALMVAHPDNGKAVELKTFSASTTSASFNYQMWVNSTTGGVTFSIRLINEHGYTDRAVTFNSKDKKFFY